LGRPGVGDGEAAGVELLVFDGAKGGIADDDIMRLLGLVLTGIELSDGVALCPQICRAIGIEFIDGDFIRIRSQQ
jgi:hypothetical protein